MQAFIPDGALDRILEIGCATGTFIESLNARERWGVEPHEGAARQARDRGVTVLTGTYEQVENSIPDGYFDLIVANDVIEHMTDHEDFLLRVRKKLSPQGRLVASVPNIRHISTLLRLLVLKDWQYRDDGVLDRTHLRFFTRRSLARSLRATGYEIERIEGLRSVFRMDAGISPRKSVANWCIGLFAVAVTLGHAWDTQYLQFGVRAKPRSSLDA